MGDQEPVVENKRFGLYLRKIREGRRLSLDAVEEMSTGYPERVTKSHLSRIENGQALPTFPRMFALSQIYGVPVSSLAERFEIEYRRELAPADVLAKDRQETLEEAAQLRRSGLHGEALVRYDALLDCQSGKEIEKPTDLRLQRINCLVQLGRHLSAKEECEDLLSVANLSPRQKVTALQLFAMCCYHLGKFTVSLIAVQQAERDLRAIEDPGSLHAHLTALKGRLLVMTGKPKDAIEPFQQALKAFVQLSDPFETCRARINVADALGGSGHSKEAARHLRDALRQSEAAGYERLRAIALSNLAELFYKDGDLKRAEAHCLLSNTIARPREFHTLVFRNCYYLWRISSGRDDSAGMRANERTLRTYLSRVDAHLPEAEAYRKHLAEGRGGEE